jgi:1-aminocyclopropane-1-carboxylate deaminase
MSDELLIQRHINPMQSPSIHLECNYHCGGYAKFPTELRSFVEQFEDETGVLLDPVYTAKMFWGIWLKVSSGEWAKGSKILAFHSGGLQGRRGFS